MLSTQHTLVARLQHNSVAYCCVKAASLVLLVDQERPSMCTATHMCVIQVRWVAPLQVHDYILK